MKKTGASMMFLTLMIVVLTAFAIAAGTQASRGANVPVTTDVSLPGQIRQGMQTGATGPGQAGGFAGGAANMPVRAGQQPGAGIWIGEMDYRPTGNLPGGPGGGGSTGPGTCQCIAAPCNCPTTGGGLPSTNLPNLNQPAINQPFQTQSPQTQSFQAQRLPPLSAPAGTAGNMAFGNAATGGVQSR